MSGNHPELFTPFESSDTPDRLSRDPGALRHDFSGEDKCNAMVGSSEGLQTVLEHIRMVAPTDSAVLIQGETGTGKELVAQAIHGRSSRRGAQFVKLNCASIPAELLESELFGHERGAFTGAVTQSIGRFQLANRGTLFLDEIGDLPRELQPKLLRVLQEQEFERLGSTQTIRVDVRVIAATNQDLFRMVQDRQFRMDLYYRLNVFPIALPPLRDRCEDIPLLLQHFVQKFSRRMNKRIETVPKEIIEMLQNHDWPGNIRELQNFVERSVIFSPGPVLCAPPAEIKRSASQPSRGSMRTFLEAEREHMIEVLRETNWVVGGADGAAARLGLPRTTLISKMRKHGIIRTRMPSHTENILPAPAVPGYAASAC